MPEREENEHSNLQRVFNDTPPQASDVDPQNEQHAVQDGAVQEWGSVQGRVDWSGAGIDYDVAHAGEDDVVQDTGAVASEEG